MRIFAFTFAVISLISSVPDVFAQGGQSGAVSGTVVERDGGRPVANATITVEGTTLTAVANGVGRFRLDGV